MPRALTIMAMAISAVFLLVFVLDLVGKFVFPMLAPFRGTSMMMDITFLVCGIILGYLSWSTYKELT